MSGEPRSAHRLYRALLWLYPPSFRREYGDDVAQAFEDELRDHGTFAGWRRTLADLTVSLPTQHLEAVMNRSVSPLVLLVLATAAVLALAAFGGVLAILAFLIVAVFTFGYWRGRLPYREAARAGTESWWRFLVAGVALLGVLIVATGVGPDFGWFPWHLLVFLVFAGCALVLVGVLLGFLNLGRRIRHRTG